MKRILIITVLSLVLCLSGCGNSSNTSSEISPSTNVTTANEEQNTKLDSLENENQSIASENKRLQEENNTLKEENDKLKAELDEYKEKEEQEKEAVTVQATDVTVDLTGKSVRTDKYDQPYIDFVFVVTNNTEKGIKGVQGVASFNDLFGKNILKLNCDFVGNTIEPGSSITVADLSMDCNQFMDDHMKLYNTKLDDLNFEYEITTIVFSDGTSKSS